MKQNKTEFKANFNLKRIYSERRFLIIGIVVSLLIHILFFSFLYFTKSPEKEKTKKEKPIKISLVPYQKIEKVQKHTGKKNVLKKKFKKKKVVKKRKISKPKKKIIKKVIKKQPVKPKKIIKKETKKPVVPKKIVKKPKPVEKKPVIKEKIVKKTPEIQKKPPIKKEIENKPVPQKTEPVPQKIEKPSPENLIIPDLSKPFEREKPEKKETKKDKAVMDYLKYIKIEFEKNKFYPDKAKKLGIEGTVILKFTILPDGTIDKKSIQVVEADHPFLARGAVRIFEKIKKLKKPPPNGEKMTVEIPIQYILYELY